VLEVSPAFAVLESATGVVPTVSGTAQVGWSHPGGVLEVALTLPPNALAKLRLPADSPAEVTVDSVAVEHAEGVAVIGTRAGQVDLRIGAGHYELRVVAPT
jgi:hypothetical protein